MTPPARFELSRMLDSIPSFFNRHAQERPVIPAPMIMTSDIRIQCNRSELPNAVRRSLGLHEFRYRGNDLIHLLETVVNVGRDAKARRVAAARSASDLVPVIQPVVDLGHLCTAGP